ncbi:MAG: alkaline phosphatase family protein [Acholeplasmataceae bacterium]
MRKPNYKHSIINISKSFLKHYQLYEKSDTHKALDQVLSKGYQHIVYMLLDGLGVNVIKKHLEPKDFLRKHLKDQITSVFPPTTVAATNAVLAANPPYTTGYVGWTQYFKTEDMHAMVFLDTDFYTGKKSEYNLREKYLSYESITKKIEQKHQDVYVSELFPDFMPNGSKTFSEHVTKIKSIIKTYDASFTYVYWTEPDLSQHDFGIGHEKIKDVITDLNHQVETLAHSFDDDVLLVVIADHGLIDVTSIDLLKDALLMSCLKRMPSIEPRATNFYVHEDHHTNFKKHFNKTYKRYFKLYSKKALYNSGLLGTGEKHPLIDDFIGDFMAIAKGSYMFGLSKGTPFKAHHAGLTDAELRVPLIIYAKNC